LKQAYVMILRSIGHSNISLNL